jgi:hypothetical protein
MPRGKNADWDYGFSAPFTENGVRATAPILGPARGFRLGFEVTVYEMGRFVFHGV